MQTIMDWNTATWWFQKSHKLLQTYIDSRIIYNILDEEAGTNTWIWRILLSKKALCDVFKNGSAFPEKCERKNYIKK